MEIGEKIKALRTEAGLNRKEFAEHFGIPLRTVEDWEAGKRKPPEYIARLIEYRIKNEQLQNKMKKGENTGGAE